MRRPVPDESLLTVEEFEHLPEEAAYLLELVRGRVVRKPRPGHEHARIVTNVVYYLRGYTAADEKRGTVFTAGAVAAVSVTVSATAAAS